jgi:hypothetical protein
LENNFQQPQPILINNILIHSITVCEKNGLITESEPLNKEILDIGSNVVAIDLSIAIVFS